VVVAIKKTRTGLLSGDEAKQMIGRTPGNIVA
jgi:actin-like ATPase involved in cell morphogenesis